MYLRKYFSELFYLVNKISVGGFLPTEMSPANNNKNNNNFFKITDVRRVLRLLCAAHYARRSEFPSLARWKRPSAPDPPRPCAVSAGRSLLACEAASPAAQEPDAVAVFVVPICCHLDDQNRDQTVTPGTSQVGIFLLLFVHHVWQRKLVRALLLPAVVTLDEGNRIIFTGAKMLRKDAFSGGWEGVTAELLMVKTWSASSGGTRGILSFTHAEAQQAEAAGASSRPLDWSSRPAFRAFPRTWQRACVRFFCVKLQANSWCSTWWANWRWSVLSRVWHRGQAWVPLAGSRGAIRKIRGLCESEDLGY